MRKIGLCLSGKPNHGGSYQFWLSMIKGFSLFDKNKYKIIVYAEEDEWFEVTSRYGFSEHVHLESRRHFLNDCMGYLYRKTENNVARFFYQYTDSSIYRIKQDKLDLWIAQVLDGVGDVLGIPSMIPIFDLMHRYEKFPEVIDKYEERERMYSHQCKYAEIILADSDVGKQHIIEAYSTVRPQLEQYIKVLPFVPPDYIYQTKIVNEMDMPLFDKYIFYPAQFWKHKNHDNLLKAIVELRRRGIETNLILVGSEQNNGEYVRRLIREYNLDKNVKILGYVSNEEMVYLYKNARALVMPSFFGPTNIPQLEAFELGCPVATSNIYAIPEQVGDAALLFDPNSVDEIAGCIERLWCDDELCRKLVEKGHCQSRKWNQQKFNCGLKEIVENYWGYYGSI